MLKDKKIAIVVPCYNEAQQVEGVIRTAPAEADMLIIIDDGSTDGMADVVRAVMPSEPRVELIVHEKNQGVGGAIASGYKFARDHGADVAVVMAGDGQMDPRDFTAVVMPIVDGEVDYAKGNRLITKDSFKNIPTSRFLGNAILSLLTKIASGYWHIADSQSGYTAIGRAALHRIDWDHMYKRYGQPNDLLVRLNIHNFRVRDIPMEPVYGVGEVSKMKKRRVIFTISWLLLRLFFFRLREKYIFRDFHPLVFFWALAFMLAPAAVALFIRLIFIWVRNGYVPEITLLTFGLCFISCLQSMCFALLFDMEANRYLR